MLLRVLQWRSPTAARTRTRVRRTRCEYLELAEAGVVGVRDLEQLGGRQAHLVDGHVQVPVGRELVPLRHVHQRLALPAQRPVITRSHSPSLKLSISPALSSETILLIIAAASPSPMQFTCSAVILGNKLEAKIELSY